MGIGKWTKTEDGMPPDLHVVIVRYTGVWPNLSGGGGIVDLYAYNGKWFNHPETVKVVDWMYDPEHLPRKNIKEN